MMNLNREFYNPHLHLIENYSKETFNVLINLLSIVLWIQLFQFCHSHNWKRLNDKNEIYPWLVQIRQKIGHGMHSPIVLGTLISPNAVITTREGVVGKPVDGLVVMSYCPYPNDSIKNDCIISNVTRMISEDSSEAAAKQQDAFSILVTDLSFNANYVKPIAIANIFNIKQNDCFFPIWPSEDQLEHSARIDLHKTAHKIKLTQGNPDVFTLKKNVIHGMIREPYYDLIRFSPNLYSDDYVNRMDGSPLVCSVKNDSSQVALVGIIPGYFLNACDNNKKNCRSVMYYVDIMSYSNSVISKLN